MDLLMMLKKCEVVLRLLVNKRITHIATETSKEKLDSGDIPTLLKEVQECIEETTGIAYCSEEPAIIEEWIATGNLRGSAFEELDEDMDDDDLPGTVQQLYEAAGNMLDDANSSDILGQLVFRTSTGKFYVMSTEASIGEADPAYLADLLKQREQEGTDERSS